MSVINISLWQHCFSERSMHETYCIDGTTPCSKTPPPPLSSLILYHIWYTPLLRYHQPLNHPKYSPLKYITVSFICLSTCMDFFSPIIDGGIRWQRGWWYLTRRGYHMWCSIREPGGGKGVYNQCNIFTYMLLPIKYFCHILMFIPARVVGCYNNIY